MEQIQPMRNYPAEIEQDRGGSHAGAHKESINMPEGEHIGQIAMVVCLHLQIAGISFSA